MENPTPGPNFGVFMAESLPKRLGKTTQHQQRLHVRESMCFELFCAHLIRRVWSACALENKKRTNRHTTSTISPLAVARLLTQTLPNLAVLTVAGVITRTSFEVHWLKNLKNCGLGQGW
jgi:hypothetical protein